MSWGTSLQHSNLQSVRLISNRGSLEKNTPTLPPADCYHLLGWTQHELHDLASALQSAQRALCIRRKLSGEIQSSTAYSYHLLGWTQHEMKNFASALQSALRAPHIRQTIFREEHIRTADSYHLLGWTQYELSCLNSAM